MSVLTFAIHDENDPNGTALGSFDDTELIKASFRVELHGVSEGLFTISRHHASADLIQENRLVKVTIPSVDSEPIFAFWLKEGDFSLVSSDEEGGEHLTFGGPGIMYILAQARLYHSSLVSDQPLRGSQDIPGQWTWVNEPYGAILTRIVEEGRENPFPDAAANGSALEHVTIDFDRVNDSDLVAWPNIDLTYEERIGTDMLQVAERLREAGDIYLVMDPDLSFHAHQSYGRDLTGSFASDNVRFEKGVNILTELKREIAARGAYTHLLQMDSDGAYSTEVLSGWTSSQRKRWGYSEASQTNDDTLLNAIGADTLRRSHTHLESLQLEVTPGFDPANGRYMPGPDGTNGHVWIGDTITLHTGTGDHDYNADANLVTAIRVVLDEASDDSTSDTAARSLHTVYELNYEDVRSARWNDGAPGGGPHTHKHGPNPELCVPGTAGTPATVVHSHPFLGDAFCSEHPGEEEIVNGGLGSGLESGFMQNGIIQTGNIQTNGVANASAVTAGVTYIVNSSIGNWPDANGTIEHYVQFRDGSASQVGTDEVIGTTTGTGRIPITGSVTAPTGAVSLSHFAHRTSGSTPGSSKMYFGAVELTLDDAVAATPRDGHPDLIGTSIKAARCDHRHDIHDDRPPTPEDNADAGYRDGIIWAQLDDLTTPTQIVAVWVLVDAENGLWLQWPTGATSEEGDESTSSDGESSALFPSSTITLTKDAGNPTFNFEAIPESIVKVGATYYAVYQNAAGSQVNLATATDRDGPWTAHADNPIFEFTDAISPGTADILYAPEIVAVEGTYYLFYSVCNATTGEDGQIGVATASEITGPYTDHGSAILTEGAASSWDSLRVGEPSVIYHDGRWIMAYMGEDEDGTFGEQERVGIATATSPTGTWTKAAGNPLIDWGSSGAWDDGLTADPYIFFENGYYWIWYTGGEPTPWKAGLAYALDPTGTWTKHADNPLLTPGAGGAWDDEGTWRGSVWVEDGLLSGIYGGLPTGGTLTGVKGGNFRLTVTAPSGASSLDALSDVAITSVEADQQLQYVGGTWVNNHRRWEPVITDTGSGPELVFTDGDIVMTWADYS